MAKKDDDDIKEYCCIWCGMKWKQHYGTSTWGQSKLRGTSTQARCPNCLNINKS